MSTWSVSNEMITFDKAVAFTAPLFLALPLYSLANTIASLSQKTLPGERKDFLIQIPIDLLRLIAAKLDSKSLAALKASCRAGSAIAEETIARNIEMLKSRLIKTLSHWQRLPDERITLFGLLDLGPRRDVDELLHRYPPKVYDSIAKDQELLWRIIYLVFDRKRTIDVDNVNSFLNLFPNASYTTKTKLVRDDFSSSNFVCMQQMQVKFPNVEWVWRRRDSTLSLYELYEREYGRLPTTRNLGAF